MTQITIDPNKIMSWATPKNWPYCSKHETELALIDSVRLVELESIEVQINGSFNRESLAMHLLRKQIYQLYRISGATRQLDNDSLESAAGLFLGKYGATCTLYAMMCYFANYTIDYKQTLKDFDLADILRQYRDRFAPHWNKLVDRVHSPQSDLSAVTPKQGIANLRQMISDRLDRGEDAYTYRTDHQGRILLDDDGRPILGGLPGMSPTTYGRIWREAIAAHAHHHNTANDKSTNYG